ncbi:D-alanyl-D-alanine carboxypeptidase [Halomonas campisalis]|uniref:D-alanyl-D-alanine carboxypeptidase n=1 Tax=Billgrantia campisalis TaxID=74661 RepID=A0ABS9PAY8_9GAMM|nr:serine hydrolase [Halomonas campisalis]MCG6658811.1 D-alanyl-D-alanine carboxypeptidase [Halomonas campisalis]MDR5864774.1 D-alanyl-D-alanine carboxypeptidase [Halomonas campisalis]
MRSSHRVRLGAVAVVLLSCLLLTIKTAHANPRYAAIVIDVESGDVLHSANADATRYPASLTKMMTLYMLFEALERGDLRLDSPLPVSAYAASRQASKLYVKAGSTLPVETAIQALVIRSANDVAVVVAEALGGSEENFGRMMTDKARQLGMPRTTFRNPNGLPDAGQTTTARDMATLSIRVMQDFPQYYHYFSQTRFSWNGQTITGHNRLLGSYPGADGLKTGFIRASGFNVATSAVRDDRRIVSVVMGGFTAASRDAHMADLLDRGYVRLSMLQRGDWIAQADVFGDRMELPQQPSSPTPAVQVASAEPASTVSLSSALQTRLTESSTEPYGRADAEMGSADDPLRDLIARAEAPQPAGAWAVQVGAFSNADQARSLASRAAERLASQVNGGRVAVAPSEGEQRVYRARLVELQESEAHSACNSLRQQGMDCMVVAHY